MTHLLSSLHLVLVNSCHELIKGIRFGAGHDCLPELLCGSMQGQRQADTWQVINHLKHARDDANCGHSDSTAAQGKDLGVYHHADCCSHWLIVVERLTHALQHQCDTCYFVLRTRSISMSTLLCICKPCVAAACKQATVQRSHHCTRFTHMTCCHSHCIGVIAHCNYIAMCSLPNMTTHLC